MCEERDSIRLTIASARKAGIQIIVDPKRRDFSFYKGASIITPNAKELEEAGVFSIAIEMVSHEVAEIISETVSVPIIGIGSGVGCDGQVLVVQDLLGMYDKIKPNRCRS